MTRDFAEHLVEQWAAARPDLDPEPMLIVVRIMRVAALLEQRLGDLLAEKGLMPWEFDMLATLRRNEPHGLPPRRLLREMLLSSGAMTNRIDRLEAAGLVERFDDPHDRRGTIVRITGRGRAMVDPVVADRFEDASDVVDLLSQSEARSVSRALRRLAIAMQQEEW